MFNSLLDALEGVVDVVTLPVRAAVGVVHTIEDEVRQVFGIGPGDRHYL